MRVVVLEKKENVRPYGGNRKHKWKQKSKKEKEKCGSMHPIHNRKQVGLVFLKIESLSEIRSPISFPKNFQDSPSHRIFGRMYGALNVDD
jgi:hypothetical protein